MTELSDDKGDERIIINKRQKKTGRSPTTSADLNDRINNWRILGGGLRELNPPFGEPFDHIQSFWTILRAAIPFSDRIVDKSSHERLQPRPFQNFLVSSMIYLCGWICTYVLLPSFMLNPGLCWGLL